MKEEEVCELEKFHHNKNKKNKVKSGMDTEKTTEYR